FILRRKFAREPCADRVHFRLSLRNGNTGLQPPKDWQPMPSAPGHPASKKRVLNERDPDFLVRIDKSRAKSRWHDSNDGEWTLVEDNRAFKNLGVCSQGPA